MADIAVHLTAVAPLPMREARERIPSSLDNQVLARMAETTTAITACRGAIARLYGRTANATHGTGRDGADDLKASCTRGATLI